VAVLPPVPPVNRPAVLVLGPHRDAISGVSTHVNILLGSGLAEDFDLVHFQVGSEGRLESPLRRLLRLAASPFQLARAIVGNGAQIVHLNTSLNAGAFWRDLVYLLVAKLWQARVIYQVHGGALPETFLGTGAAAAGFLRAVLRLPDLIVVLAKVELRSYTALLPGQRVIALPNAIDCTPYAAAARPPCANPAEPLKLAYVGRLAREKGLYELLRGMKLAIARGANVRLTIAGSGPDQTPLMSLCAALDLDATVSFVGPVFGREKAVLLGESDALVLASYSEGLPYALLEAMAAGTPAIATGVGAIPDVVVDGVHGLLVAPRDPVAIGRAIERLATNRDALARMSAACSRRIAAAYCVERLAESFFRAYAGLCEAKPMKALTRS